MGLFCAEGFFEGLFSSDKNLVFALAYGPPNHKIFVGRKTSFRKPFANARMESRLKNYRIWRVYIFGGRRVKFSDSVHDSKFLITGNKISVFILKLAIFVKSIENVGNLKKRHLWKSLVYNVDLKL